MVELEMTKRKYYVHYFSLKKSLKEVFYSFTLKPHFYTICNIVNISTYAVTMILIFCKFIKYSS